MIEIATHGVGAIVGVELGAPLVEVGSHVANLKVLQVEHPQFASRNNPLPEADAGTIEGGIELLLQQAVFMLQSGNFCLQPGQFTNTEGGDQGRRRLRRALLSPCIFCR
ncbi:hypothetical protein [Aeromonas jandaei]|uniref:hypothetical protein n=1 Tax=Aeromonas jandaei TaxID=650 RepID=UPI00207B72F6|nr:hypothetical protein [Aeromonas jandaei]